VREDEPQLLLRIGFDNLLDFRDGFRVALADVLECVGRDTNLLTGIDDGHAVDHALDDLQGSIDPGGFSDRMHRFILP